MLSCLARCCRDRRAGASLLGVFLILISLSLVTFTIEVSYLYAIQVRVQRTADLADMAATVGATAPIVQSGAASTSAVATALNVASINGFGASAVNTTGASPTSSTNTLTTSISNTPSPIMGNWIGSVSPTVKATAQALMTSVVVSDCIATIGGTLQISGSATATASGCGVASQSTISMSGGSFTASAAAVGVHAYDEIPLITGGTPSPGTGSFMYNAKTTDTAASTSSVTAVQAHLQSLASWPYGSTIPQTAAAQSVASGSAQTFTSQTATVPANTHWGALTLTGSTLNFAGSGGADITCTSPTTISGATQLNGSNTLNFNSGCYIFNGSVTTDTGGSSSVTNFNIVSGSTVVFYFQNAVNVNVTNGGQLNLGNAYSYAFLGAITLNYGGNFTVGTGIKMFTGNITSNSGNITFGNGTSYLNGTTVYSGLYGNAITFGNGAFYLWNGAISNVSNQTLGFGTGPFYFYNSAISNGTRGQGPVNFAGGNYYFYGGSITTGGNYFAMMNFAAGNMDLYANASISVASKLQLGNGSTYSGGTTVSLYGGSVTVTSGPINMISGTLALTTGSLNVSGSGSLLMVAPTSATPTYGYTNLSVLSTSGNIIFTGSSSSSLGGLLYAPNSTVTVSQNAVLQAASYWGQYCLSIIANTLALSGSSSTSLYPCAGLSATSTGNNSTLSQ